MSCFPGTTLARLVATYCRSINSCSTLFYLSTKALHTSCIMIGLHQPSETFFTPIHIPNTLLKKSSCGPETAIYGPITSSEYTGCTQIVHALGLMDLSTMAPLVLSRALSTVVSNDVSKLSTINTSDGVSFSVFSLL